jgi:hypothetical protein
MRPVIDVCRPPNDPGVQLQTHRTDIRSVDDARCVRMLQWSVRPQDISLNPPLTAHNGGAHAQERLGRARQRRRSACGDHWALDAAAASTAAAC